MDGCRRSPGIGTEPGLQAGLDDRRGAGVRRRCPFQLAGSPARRRAMSVTYHLVPREYWQSQPADRPYAPAAFDHEGFVHCTDGLDELVQTGNRHCRSDSRPYVALVLDVERLASPVRYE